MSNLHKLSSFVAIVLSIISTGWAQQNASLQQNASQEVSFSRDVLPILSDRCFHCHGPDESNRKAGLRLDLEENAKEDLGGYAAVAPGNLQDSELWRRINSEDEGEVMPPPDSHRKPFTDAERESIRKWILAGAVWGKHWSLEPLKRPPVPATASHPIDAFIQSRLTANGLKLSPPAAPRTQLRRLSFDLTGLAPTSQELSTFGNGSNEARLAAIDRLLDSPHHAERMAMWWLDAARYSDSDGFQQDATRQNWPWRDWVIQQFHTNKSFRDFTIEQFAGDLLPSATPEQILATCFHRNHMTNGEGGRDPEESRIDYVIDRVNTTGTVWLGLTLGCVQCHSHKFDPISHEDYYAMSAFFNSIDEDGRAGMSAKPYLNYQSNAVADRIKQTANFVQQCRNQHQQARALAEKEFEQWLDQRVQTPPQPHRVWRTPRPQVFSAEGTTFAVEADQTIQTAGPPMMHDDYRIVLPIPQGMTRVTGVRLDVLPHPSHVNQRFSRDGNGEFTLTSVLAMLRRKGSPAESQLDLARATADFESDKKRESQWDRRYANISETLNDDARDGWTTEGAKNIEPHVGLFELAEPCQVQPGDRFIVVLRQRSTHGHANIGRFRISLTDEQGETLRRIDGGSPLSELNATLKEKKAIPPSLRKRLQRQYLLGHRPFQMVDQKLRRAQAQLDALKREASPRKVMVLADRKHARPTHILERGVWDAKGKKVQPAVLPSVLAWPADKTRSRLDLARWLVDKQNPLTPRVIVNHLWQLMFGQGIVRTPGDFGLQGELPTHPELLDWLAVELVEHDWDLQHILILIATSQTYLQSSDVNEQLLEIDPENRLLARAPRFRLPAWMIRDNALQVAGLLNPAVGGPPVKPYQPAGIWGEITMGRFRYQPSLGPDQYRRTIYAFWRRSSAPTFLFDSAQRRVCEVGIRRTNTPLHALTLLNDETMLEASRAIADRIVRGSSSENNLAANELAQATNQSLDRMAIQILSRPFENDEREKIRAVFVDALKTYQAAPEDAIQFCQVGQQPKPSLASAPSTAAWMTVASLVLNLDEAITRE